MAGLCDCAGIARYLGVRAAGLEVPYTCPLSARCTRVTARGVAVRKVKDEGRDMYEAILKGEYRAKKAERAKLERDLSLQDKVGA